MQKNLFEEFDEIPVFSKSDLRMVFNGNEDALNERIKRAIANKKIIPLKKGMYIYSLYWLKESNKTAYLEFLASKLRWPSYLSLEYVLAKYNLLTEATYPITSVTIKTSRNYQNQLGNYNYYSLKKNLFTGFQKQQYANNTYFIATVAKALFDWFYLKKNLRVNRKEIIEDLRINWYNFSQNDFVEFREYVKISNSTKMQKIAKILEKGIYANK